MKKFIEINHNKETRFLNLDEVTQIIWAKKSNKIIFNFKSLVNAKNTTFNNHFVPAFHYLLTKDDFEAEAMLKKFHEIVKEKSNDFSLVDDRNFIRIINFSNINSIMFEDNFIFVNFATSFSSQTFQELQEHSIKLSYPSNATKTEIENFIKERL